MPSKVYTLTQTNNRTGFVIGVFTNRAQAIEAAQSHADHTIRRFVFAAGHLVTPPDTADNYETQLVTTDDRTKLVIRYRPTDELDWVSWDIWPFDVIEPAASIAGDVPADHLVAAE
jgi:hypothetical protein